MAFFHLPDPNSRLFRLTQNLPNPPCWTGHNFPPTTNQGPPTGAQIPVVHVSKVHPPIWVKIGALPLPNPQFGHGASRRFPMLICLLERPREKLRRFPSNVQGAFTTCRALDLPRLAFWNLLLTTPGRVNGRFGQIDRPDAVGGDCFKKCAWNVVAMVKLLVLNPERFQNTF